MSYLNDIEALKAALPNLSSGSRDFANSLIASAEGRGLSEKQLYWVRKLAEPPAPPTTVEVGDLTNVLTLFDNARKHLKFPKVKLALEDGSPVVLSVAGPGAKAPGTINVTDGGSYGNNKWFGRIATTGAWEVSKAAGESATSIAALLTRFALEPEATAAAYGKLVGSCCFCSRTLTDKRSTEVGYGPVCADHFGLAWG
jgi:hypothetical protein